MKFYYISNPYNGTAEEMRERARVAAEACATLLRRGVHAWSPIVHNHALLAQVPFTLEERRELILPFDFTLLRASRGMIVLKIPGWDRSYGVSKEIELCAELGLPVHYLEPTELAEAAL